jgi:Rad3-related DNA helicase
MESQFPAKNRQVIVQPVANMTRKGETEDGYRKLEGSIRSILERHPRDRVVVHSVSYALADRVLGACARDRAEVFTYRLARDRPASIADFRRTPGSVLVAPSADRGVDLPGDLCRVQIILKVPFLSLGDKQVTKRLYETKDGQVWYNVQVARTIQQMVGRAVRSTDDWAVCYVLDSSFVKWYREWGHLLPKWFRKGIRFEL